MTKLPSVSIPEKLVADWKYILQAVARLPRKDPEDEKQSSAQKFNSMLKGYYNDIQAIWESYTSDRKKLGREAFTTRKNVVAYFAGFHLSNAARLTMLLQRLEQRSPQLLKTLRTNTLDIFDFGCGSGAGTQTFAEYVGVEQVESVILIDRSRAFLDLAKQVTQAPPSLTRWTSAMLVIPHPPQLSHWMLAMRGTRRTMVVCQMMTASIPPPWE